jgi:LL-diaminopimelate aminotransferase
MFVLKEKTAQLKPELTARNRAPISLAMGAPTAAPPEFAIKRLKELLDEEDIHTYSTPKGEPYFRNAVSQRMKTRFGVDINPETEVFSLIGSKEGLANLIRSLVNPCSNSSAGAAHFNKDIILVPDPGYASYREFTKCSGGLAYPIPLTLENDYKPDMEEVLANLVKEGYDPKKVKAMILNFPNNPLGAITTKEYVQSVVKFCKKHEILLISDAAYCDLYFDAAAKPFSVFEIEGAKEIAVEFFSFSKPYALTGWRVGWVCGNSEIVSRFGKAKSTIDNGIFKALQIACADVLNSKEGDEYIARENEGYKRKQALMVKGFQELGWNIDVNSPSGDSPDKVGIIAPPATFYLWLPIPPRYKSAFEFCEEVLEKSGVVIVPGNAFGDCGEGFFRVSCVCSEAELQTVIDRLKEDGFFFD